MKNIITVDDFKKEAHKAKIKRFFREKVNSTKDFIYNNRETILVLGPAVIGATVTMAKMANGHIKLNKEKDLKDLYCYDRSLGHYWKLRRELTNTEWVEIDKRKNNGERLSDILSEMKVLK